MALQRTTTINLTDSSAAKTQYDDLMASSKIVMVILGDSPSVNDGVILADKRARQLTTNEKLWVMYVGNHTTLKAELAPFLHDASIIRGDTPYEEIKAFCLSRAPRKAESRVHINGALKTFKIDLLFREAISNSPLDTNA